MTDLEKEFLVENALDTYVNWAFEKRFDDDSKIWKFTGRPFQEDLCGIIDGNEYEMAKMNVKQLMNAFIDPKGREVENGYGYIMLKGNRVRQISL